MASIDIGIDLGTATVIVYLGNKGIVLKEPSVVALNINTGEVLSVGEEAYRMIGRTPNYIRAIRPLEDGVISDYDATEQMIKYFLKKVSGGAILRPRVSVCVPSGITEVESNAVVDAAVAAGARKVYLIEEPVAAAIGAGIDITRPNGVLIVDVGGGTCDIAMLSLAGIVSKTSIKVAGNKFDAAVIRHIRNTHNILIGERTAEMIKQEIGNVYVDDPNVKTMIKGRNLVNGLPQKLEISQADLYAPLNELAMQIVHSIQQVLERTPPELVGDVYNNGVLLTGGGSLIQGMPELITHHLHIKAAIAENPVECVAIGTGRSFNYLGELQDGFIGASAHRH
ncbi:MAG: rod shape-determining protein [Provencibacterium sp.]|jgi:rod shape-determining protein MreB|nr:rod shape-determining protein [Provencibacterium sp.]